ncbi:MAG: peptidoglycan-binding protein [Candidatus Hydrogenedentes bacterium]|nr:peptidoglycan-binding protein [Candidatus Hydrogenedentota bacterium]
MPTYKGAVRKGDKGQAVTEVQEWLGFHDCGTGIDGDYGDATEKAVQKFQKKKGIAESGVVNRATFDMLVQPMTGALADIPPGGRTLAQLVVAYARQHLKPNPREIGGQNMGPWVRLYMDGHEGTDWPWCAGFATYIVKVAAAGMGVPMPVKRTFSCDALASDAKGKGIFIKLPDVSSRSSIKPGALFLRRKSSTDWSHTGIVTRVDSDTFETIEGNTNDAGDREGYEVCARVRAFGEYDFITT